MRHVEHVMGTVVSFDVRQRPPGDPAVTQAVADAVAWLHWVDETFSTYRDDSPVSRLGRGEITLAECPPEVAEILRLCDQMADASRGYFTAHPGGRLDPSAMVKGWAIERASDILLAAGVMDHNVNGGGDIQISGSPAPDRPWRFGVANPFTPGALATVITAETRGTAQPRDTARDAADHNTADHVAAGRRLAIATSGTAERGEHIIDPHTGRPATALASITIVGESLTAVDAYATAAFAMGDSAREWIERSEGLEAFAITATGATWRTSAFPDRAGQVVSST